MNIPLHELIGYIPTGKDGVDNLPPGISNKKYWEVNNTFINAYDNKSDITLVYRCKYAKKRLKVVIRNFKWYFYVHQHEFKKIPVLEIKKLKKELDIKIVPIAQYYRIYVNNKSINEMYDDTLDDRLVLKEILKDYNVELLEFDIRNYKRFCIDNEIESTTDFKIIYFDIETDDRNDGIIIGRDRILSFAAYDQDGKKKFFIAEEDTDEGEKELMKKVWDYIANFDVIVGWNSSNFDVPYLRERYKRYFKYYPNMKDIAHIDFMKRFQKLFYYDAKIRSWSLNFISNYFLGDQKLKFTGGIYNLFKNDKKTLRKYNLKDCQLLLQLEEKLKVLELIILECKWCGCFPSKFYISELLDNYILRYSNKQNIHFKSATFGNKKEEDEHVQGGYVMDPKRGIHDDVYVLDYKSLYPTIIMSWNISLETFVKTEPNMLENHIKTVNGFWTKKNQKGMLPIIIKRLLDERKTYKKIQMGCEFGSKEYAAAFATQVIVKELSNSLYGIMAQRGNRYYDKDVAESITLAGQYLDKLAKKLMSEHFGYDTIYCDTDSTFTVMGKSPDMTKILDKIHDEFEKIFKRDFNIDKSYIALEYEKKFSKLILLQKKQYVGRLVEIDGKSVDEVYGKGMDYIKRNTIEYGRKHQIELLRRMFYENYKLKECVKYVEDTLNDFNSGNIDVNDIVIQNKISRSPEKYKTKLVHVKVAERMIKESKEFYVGMFIPYVVTVSEPKLDGVHIDDYKEGEYDKRYYWDMKTYALLKRILECMYPKYDWDQYEYETLRKRKKKIIQYTKWLNDKKKNKDVIRQKIEEDKIMSRKQKDELLGKKKKFKLKMSNAANNVKKSIIKN